MKDFIVRQHKFVWFYRLDHVRLPTQTRRWAQTVSHQKNLLPFEFGSSTTVLCIGKLPTIHQQENSFTFFTNLVHKALKHTQ